VGVRFSYQKAQGKPNRKRRNRRRRRRCQKRATRKLDYVVKRRLAGIFLTLHLQLSPFPAIRLCRYNKILVRKGKVEQAAANTHTLIYTRIRIPRAERMNERSGRTKTKAKQQNNRNAANETVMEENNKRQASIKVPSARRKKKLKY